MLRCGFTSFLSQLALHCYVILKLKRVIIYLKKNLKRKLLNLTLNLNFNLNINFLSGWFKLFGPRLTSKVKLVSGASFVSCFRTDHRPSPSRTFILLHPLFSFTSFLPYWTRIKKNLWRKENRKRKFTRKCFASCV